jgi:hypothetical protein
MMFRKIFLSLAALVLMTVATGCAAPEPQADFATDQVCEDLVKFTTSLEALQDEAAYSDVNAVKAQFDVVRTNFNSLVASTQNLETAEKEDFETAVAGLMEAVEDVPADASVPETLTTLQEPIGQVRDAAENLRTGLECQ